MRAFFYARSQSMNITFSQTELVPTLIILGVIVITITLWGRWFDRRPSQRRRDLIDLINALRRK